MRKIVIATDAGRTFQQKAFKVIEPDLVASIKKVLHTQKVNFVTATITSRGVMAIYNVAATPTDASSNKLLQEIENATQSKGKFSFGVESEDSKVIINIHAYTI